MASNYVTLVTHKPANRIALLLLLFLAPAQTLYAAKGELHDAARDRTIPYEIWVPESDKKVPLIVLSHGSGGDYKNHNWLINALVQGQYAVLALNHPKNTARDQTDEGVVTAWERPLDITRLLDDLLAKEAWSRQIDSSRIGAAGFSSGGYTAMALAGAIFNPDLMTAYCESALRGADCDLASDVNFEEIDFSQASNSYFDKRVKAIFTMAPAVGTAIEPQSLRDIDIPVFIVAAKDDELLNPELHAQYYATNIPGAQIEMISSGGHFVFMECSFVTRIADWFITDLELCDKLFEDKREKIWPSVANEAISFFDKHL